MAAVVQIVDDEHVSHALAEEPLKSVVEPITVHDKPVERLCAGYGCDCGLGIVPAATQSSGRTAEVSSPPAPPSPLAARPGTSPKPASAPAPSGATAAGIDEPPPGFVPHEPGS